MHVSPVQETCTSLSCIKHAVWHMVLCVFVWSAPTHTVLRHHPYIMKHKTGFTGSCSPEAKYTWWHHLHVWSSYLQTGRWMWYRIVACPQHYSCFNSKCIVVCSLSHLPPLARPWLKLTRQRVRLKYFCCEWTEQVFHMNDKLKCAWNVLQLALRE